MRTSSVLFSIAMLALLMAGCGPSADLPEVVPVSGTVTLDGEPLSGATVVFIPTGSTAGRAAQGGTDATGRYELSSGEQKGAPAGEFKVVVQKWVMPDGSDFKGGEMSPLEAGAQEKLPARYSSEEATELKATVPGGGGTIDFDLKTN